MENETQQNLSRRDFVRTAATTLGAAVALTGGAQALRSEKAVKAAESEAQTLAPIPGTGRPLKIGLIGCGGRGSGAAMDAMKADPNVKVVALADIYKDRLDGLRNNGDFKKMTEVADNRCFLGFDAYQKLAELKELDYVILATPPYYRPIHLPACIEAGKNVFMEKPVAVDPVGIRKILAAGEQAKQKGLSIVAGTQRRHEKGYIETIKRIHDGEIGQLVAAQCYWNMGQLWFRKREASWSESEWMHRDWVNWRWLSGDHIVEQHVHNLDVINWAIGTHPIKVVAMGGRARRVTGDQYDYFSADFEFPGEVHVLSQCRQVNGCKSDVSERVIGTKGRSNCNKWLSTSGQFEVKNAANPYVQEHADLIQAIRTGKPINEAKNVAESTMCAIMARESAYTGEEIKWDDIMKSELELKAPDYPLTDENVRAHIPVPGKA